MLTQMCRVLEQAHSEPTSKYESGASEVQHFQRCECVDQH